MTPTQALKALRTAGTAQNRKIYGRHGVKDPMYGVSYAELGRLKKKLGTDHGLARQLWASGNHDARILATMVADPTKLTSAEIDRWARELSNYVVADAFSKLVADSPHASRKMDRLMRSRNEWTGRAGWLLCAHLVRREGVIDDASVERYLVELETSTQSNKNRVKDAMNSALIAIGLRSARFEKKAIAAAKRIGHVDVDHGETSCKTPDAIAYIKKTKARSKKR